MSKGHGYKYDWRGDLSQAMRKKSMMLNEKYKGVPRFNSKLVCLNIGCGFDRREGFVSIDNSPLVNPDVVCDLDTQKLPYKDNSVDEIYSRHSFEHFSQPVQVLEELYRVSKHGAIWTIIVPFGYSWNDHLFHKSIGFHWNTFDRFLVNNNRPYYTKVRLKVLKVEGHADGWLRFLPFKRKFSSLFNNIFREIYYEFEVVK